ncbi:precorrin-3B synthase [Bradyrhizobium genosp. P]|uniref:precorrin-3B synthase n=1 Tax=Bradyrhizobium genosp. P TaxID=83641 RepID=UPI003CF0C7FE
MNGFAFKGWCPSALRPMPSGDGLVVRLRQRGGRLSSAQAAGIAELSARHGNGLIDLTGRANLQIRGVSEQSHGPLIEGLDRLGLVEAELSESQRNILIAPFWTPGDDASSLAAELEQALAKRSLGLPEKFGFAIDCGSERVLAQTPADIRIERCIDGGLVVRADGASHGRKVAREEAIDAVHALVEWFVASGGTRGRRGRMAAHVAVVGPPDNLAGDTQPAPALAPPKPGFVVAGGLVGFAFGLLSGETLGYLAGLSPGLRLTPWRMVLVEGLREMPQHDDLVTDADDPLLRVTACTGAPSCPEAHAETRQLAAVLAPHIAADAHLHVSGCAKGCAHPTAAGLTLVGTSDGFDLVRHGTARDVPAMRGLARVKILADPGTWLGGR